MNHPRRKVAYRFLYAGRNLLAHLLCLLLIFSMPVLAQTGCEGTHIETAFVDATCFEILEVGSGVCPDDLHNNYGPVFDPDTTGCDHEFAFPAQLDPDLAMKRFQQGATKPSDQRNVYDMGVDPATLNPEALDLNIFPTFEISAELSLIPSLSYAPDRALARMGRLKYGPPKQWRNHYGEIVVMVAPTKSNKVPVGAPILSSTTMPPNTVLDHARYPVVSELQVFFINASGQQVNFYPDPDLMQHSAPISGQMGTWYSEDGTYRLVDLNAGTAAGPFQFELRTSSGLKMAFEPYTYHLDSDQEALTRHFRVAKITDRHDNYVDVSYRDEQSGWQGDAVLQPDKVKGFDNTHNMLQELTYTYDARHRLKELILPAYGSGVTQTFEFLYLDSGDIKDLPLGDGTTTNRLDLNNIYSYTLSGDTNHVIIPRLKEVSGFLETSLGPGGLFLNFEELGFVPESAVDFQEVFTSGGYTGTFRSAAYKFHIDDTSSSALMGPDGAARQIHIEEEFTSKDPIRYRYKLDGSQYPADIVNASTTPPTTVAMAYPDYVDLNPSSSGLNRGEVTVSVLPRLKDGDLLAWVGSSNTIEASQLKTLGITPTHAGSGSYTYPLTSPAPSSGLRLIRKDQRDRIAEIVYPAASGSFRKRMLFKYAENSRNHAEIEEILVYDEPEAGGDATLLSQTTYTYEHVLVQTAAEDLESMLKEPLAEDQWRNCVRTARALEQQGTHVGVTYGVNLRNRHEVIDILRHKRLRIYEPGLIKNESNIPFDDYRDLETFYGGAWRFALLGLGTGNEDSTRPPEEDPDQTCDLVEWGIAQKPFSFTWQINPDGSAQIFDLSADGVGLDPTLAYANTGVRVFKTYQFDTAFKASLNASNYSHFLGYGTTPFSPYYQYLPTYEIASSASCSPCSIPDLEMVPKMPSNRVVPTMADLFAMTDTKAYSATIQLFEPLPMYGYTLLTDIHPDDRLKKLTLGSLHGSIQQTGEDTPDRYYYRISAIHGIEAIANGDSACEVDLVDTYFRGLWTSEVSTHATNSANYNYDVPWTYGGNMGSSSCFQYIHQRQKNHRLRPHAQIQLQNLRGYQVSDPIEPGFKWDSTHNILDLEKDGTSHVSPWVVEASRFSNGGYLGEGSAASVSDNGNQSTLTGLAAPAGVQAGDYFYYQKEMYQLVGDISGDTVTVKPAIGATSSALAHLTFYRFYDPDAPPTRPYLGYDVFGNNAFKATYKRNEIKFTHPQDKANGKDHGLVPNFFDSAAIPFTLSLNDSTAEANNDDDDWLYFGRVTRRFDTGKLPLTYDDGNDLVATTDWKMGMVTDTQYPTSAVAYPWLPVERVNYFVPSPLTQNLEALNLSSLAGISIGTHVEDFRISYRYYRPISSGISHAYNSTNPMSHGRLSLEWSGKSSIHPGQFQWNSTRYEYDSYGWTNLKETAVFKAGGLGGEALYGTHAIIVSDPATGLANTEETYVFDDPVWNNTSYSAATRSSFSGTSHLRSRTVNSYDLLGRPTRTEAYDANNQRFGPTTITSYPSQTQTVTITQDTLGLQLSEARHFTGGSGQDLAQVRKRGDETQAYASYSNYDAFGRLVFASAEQEFPDGSDLSALAQGDAAMGGYTQTLYNLRGEPFGTVIFQEVANDQDNPLQATWSVKKQDPTNGNMSTWGIQQVPDADLSQGSAPDFLNIKVMDQNAYGLLTRVADYRQNLGTGNTLWTTQTEANLKNIIGTLTNPLSQAEYTYNRTGKVTEAKIGVFPTQLRKFSFDQRDRLRVESHPEMKKIHTDQVSVVYGDFDHFDNPQTVVHKQNSTILREWTSTYDTAGNLLEWRATGTPDIVTTYRYNHAVAGTPSAYPELPRIIHHQDELGRAMVYRHDYDPHRGLLTGRSLYHNHNGFPGYMPDTSLSTLISAADSSAHASYVFDAMGRVEFMTYPATIKSLLSPTELEFSYGSHGFLTQVDDLAYEAAKLTLIENITYGVGDQLSNVAFATPLSTNKNQLSKTYDILNRLDTWETHWGTLTEPLTYSRAYAYDKAGRIDQIQMGDDSDDGFTYSYDGLGQIAKAHFNPIDSHDPTTWIYGYDSAGFGNLTSLSINNTPTLPANAVDLSNNHLDADATYNDLGEMTGFTDANDTTSSMTYNAMGRMTGMNHAGMDADYHYDHAGMRVFSKVEGSQAGLDQTETLYFYDAEGMVLCEWASEKQPNNTWSTPHWDKTYIYLAGNSSLTYEYDKAEGTSPPTVPEIPQPLVLQNGLLSWTHSAGPYTLELADEHMQPVRTFKGLISAQYRFGKRLKYGKYHVRLKRAGGPWGSWQEIYYMSTQAQDLAGDYGFDQSGDDGSYFRNHLEGIESIGYSFGQYHDALAMDPGERLAIEDPHQFLASGSDGTLSAWIKLPPLGSEDPPVVRRLFWEYELISLWVTNHGTVELKRKGTAFQQASLGLPLDDWAHLALVYGDSHAELHINGQLVLNASHIPTIFQHGDMSLGSLSSSIGFEGLLDQVRIYNRGLTPNEILTEATP